MKKFWISIIVSICLNGCASMQNKNPSKEILYVGTGSDDIYVFEFDRAKPALKPLQTVPAVKPTFLAIHPNRKFLYSANRVTLVPSQDWGSVAAWAIDPASGKLTLLNEQSAEGKDPNHIGFDKTGEWLFVSNYRGDNIAVFPVRQDGSLSPASDVKNHAETAADGSKITAHPHSVVPSPDNHYFYTQNLGTDKIITYTLNRETGKLTRVNNLDIVTPKGNGPRHALFSADGKYYYVDEELSSTVSSYKLNKTGELVFMQRLSTLPAGMPASSANKVADIQIHPNRKFLYVSNRGHDSVAIYSISANGQLTFLKTQPALGSHPRNILIDSTGQFLMLANERSDKVVIFTANEKNGDITPAGLEVKVPAPTCLHLLKLE
jgi:6-phosphogluconolactonase